MHPQFFFVEPIDVAQDFGGELAASTLWAVIWSSSRSCASADR